MGSTYSLSGVNRVPMFSAMADCRLAVMNSFTVCRKRCMSVL